MAKQDQIEPPLGLTGKKSDRLQALPPVIMALILLVFLFGCTEEKKSMMHNVDPETFPTMLTTDVSTLVSDSGYTRYHITADLWLMFDEAEEPHWKFPDGLYMEKYNDSMEVEATFRSDSALYLSQKRRWQFDGNVRMKNVDGDRFATEQLFWDQEQQKVYSDSFVHIERPDRILEGYGFVSNEQMTEYTILNVSGIFPTPQRKEDNSNNEAMAVQDSITADTIPAATENNSSRATRRKTPQAPSKRSNPPSRTPVDIPVAVEEVKELPENNRIDETH